MNKEFKKTTKANEVIYTLEAASAGATSSAAVATGPVGKKGNLLVQSKDDKPIVQKRNPVAANVNATVGGGGSGAHKDRKQAAKRGEFKHKKDWRKDVDETVDEVKQRLDPKCWKGYKKQGTKMKGGVRVNNCVPKEGVAEGYGMGAYATVAGSEPVAKHVPEQVDSDRISALEVALANAKSIVRNIKYDDAFMEIITKISMLAEKNKIDVKYEVNDAYEANNSFQSTVFGLVSPFEDALRDEKLKDNDDDLDEGAVDPSYIDQENGMTTSDLKALYHQAVKLRSLVKRMGNDTTLEPWQQTKIAKAADYINSVFRSLDDEYGLDKLQEAEKKGLWANIHARKKKGLSSRKPGEKGAPSKKSWDTAVAASKKKKAVGEDNLEEYERYRYTDDDGNEWEVDDEGNKTLLNPSRYSGGYKSRYSKPYNPLPKKSSQPEVYYFYNVPDGAAMKAFDLGLKRTKSGKWYARSPIDSATKLFGNPKKWVPKTEEGMMPASHFAGTPKNKLGPAAHLKGKMKRPARQGDLVGGSAEESFEKKKILKKN